MCCSSWGRKESDMTEKLNSTEFECFLMFFSTMDSFWNLMKALDIVCKKSGYTHICKLLFLGGYGLLNSFNYPRLGIYALSKFLLAPEARILRCQNATDKVFMKIFRETSFSSSFSSKIRVIQVGVKSANGFYFQKKIIEQPTS